MKKLTQKMLGTGIVATGLCLAGCGTIPYQDPATDTRSDGEKIMDAVATFGFNSFADGAAAGIAARNEAQKGNYVQANRLQGISEIQGMASQREIISQSVRQGVREGLADVEGNASRRDYAAPPYGADGNGFRMFFYNGLGNVGLVFSNRSINFNQKRFEGIKTEFGKNEPMSVSVGVFDRSPLGDGSLETQILRSDGKEIVKFNPTVSFSSYELTKERLGIGPGSYNVILRTRGGDVIGEGSFKIND